MSAEHPGKSHAARWVLSVLTVPVLYVLSVPPLTQLCGRYAPKWSQDADAYGVPFTWLRDNAELEAPLDSYSLWWMKLILLPPVD